jgi:hypothetical protein
MKTKIIASSLFAILPMMPSFAAKALYGDAPDAKHAGASMIGIVLNHLAFQ